MIKYKDVNVGSITMPYTNYYEISTGIESGHKIISGVTYYWSTNSGSFSIIPYENNRAYIVANSGVSISNLVVRFYYI